MFVALNWKKRSEGYLYMYESACMQSVLRILLLSSLKRDIHIFLCRIRTWWSPWSHPSPFEQNVELIKLLVAVSLLELKLELWNRFHLTDGHGTLSWLYCGSGMDFVHFMISCWLCKVFTASSAVIALSKTGYALGLICRGVELWLEVLLSFSQEQFIDCCSRQWGLVTSFPSHASQWSLASLKSKTCCSNAHRGIGWAQKLIEDKIRWRFKWIPLELSYLEIRSWIMVHAWVVWFDLKTSSWSLSQRTLSVDFYLFILLVTTCRVQMWVTILDNLAGIPVPVCTEAC